MFDNAAQKPTRSALQVFLGVLLGTAISVGCSLLAIFIGIGLKVGRDWMFPLLVAMALVGSGLIALKQVRESSLAVGVVIALSVALLLDGICAAAFLR